jgi:hypothetical protein
VCDYQDKEAGLIHIEMQLRADGRIRYEETGGHEALCTGTWAYADHRFWARFDEIREAKAHWAPALKQFQAWEVTRCEAGALTVRMNQDDVAFLRKPRVP